MVSQIRNFFFINGVWVGFIIAKGKYDKTFGYNPNKETLLRVLIK